SSTPVRRLGLMRVEAEEGRPPRMWFHPSPTARPHCGSVIVPLCASRVAAFHPSPTAGPHCGIAYVQEQGPTVGGPLHTDGWASFGLKLKKDAPRACGSAPARGLGFIAGR